MKRLKNTERLVWIEIIYLPNRQRLRRRRRLYAACGGRHAVLSPVPNPQSPYAACGGTQCYPQNYGFGWGITSVITRLRLAPPLTKMFCCSKFPDALSPENVKGGSAWR